MKTSYATESNDVTKVLSLMICSDIPWNDISMFVSNYSSPDDIQYDKLLCDVCAHRREVDIVQFTDKCTDVNIRANNTSTPLMFTCERGLLTASKYLIDKGAHVISRSNKSTTPLTYARNSGNTELIVYIGGLAKEASQSPSDLLKKQAELKAEQDRMRHDIERLTEALMSNNIDDDRRRKKRNVTPEIATD